MNLRSLCYFHLLVFLARTTNSFTTHNALNRVEQQLSPNQKCHPRFAFALPVTASTVEDIKKGLLETYEGESSEDDMDADGEKELVLGFVQLVQSTLKGDLQVDEIDLLREIMAAFPGDLDGLEAAQAVESLLKRLMDEWEAASNTDDSAKEEAFRPSAEDFSVAISAWQKSENPDKVTHVLSILSDQRELFRNGLTTVQPDLSTIKAALTVLVQSREKGLDKRASQVFASLADYGLTPDPELYGLMITIIAKSRARGAAQRAEKLLREAVSHHPPQMVDGIVTGIDVASFNVVVTAYAKSREGQGPKQAEDLIIFMDQTDSENGSLGICTPNAKTFTSLIDAYCQQNEWESVSEADRTLNRLLEQYLEGNDDLEPNVATWTIVISAWTRLSKKNRWGAAERAGRLLARMEDLHNEGRISFKPDAITYVTCMNAYAYAKNGEGAAEAERLLDEMNEMYLDGDDSMKPSARSVKLCVESWIKAGDLEKAEDLLNRYEECIVSEEDTKAKEDMKDVYTSMLFACTQNDNISKATFYLSCMIEQGQQPDSVCFDRIIEANTRIAEKHSLKSSLGVFEWMEQCRRAGDINPNERVYTSFIRALTKGRAQGLHKKASMLLQRMQNLYETGNEGIRPTVFTYNAVLNACAESLHIEDESRTEAFKTAVRVFTDLRSSGKERPDHVTFGNMLRCANLLPEGEQRDKFVSATFRLCCEQGFVNTFVVRDLVGAASDKLWRSLLDCPAGEADFDTLPLAWSCMANRGKEKGSSKSRR